MKAGSPPWGGTGLFHSLLEPPSDVRRWSADHLKRSRVMDFPVVGSVKIAVPSPVDRV